MPYTSWVQNISVQKKVLGTRLDFDSYILLPHKYFAACQHCKEDKK